MVETLAAPAKYYQGPDILRELYTYIEHIGEKFAVLTDNIVLEIVGDRIREGFEGTGATYDVVLFAGESTREEADRIVELTTRGHHDGIIGIGGGKVTDTAKLVADISGLPVVIIPTAAATDAACSAMSVVYDENGTFVVSKKMKKNPDVVLVDTAVIMGAPLRTFIAGVGDAFACYYEAKACRKSGAMNYNGGVGTQAAFAIAELCNKVLRENAVCAKAAVEKKQWSEALDKTIEANIYLGGVGFENNGCAIAHGVYNGMTAVIKPFHAMHGEAVAVGTLIQLAAEKVSTEEWNDVTDFYKQMGLPVCFEDLGVKNLDDELIMKIADAACTVSPNVHKMPFDVTPALLFDAIRTVQERNGGSIS
ncbi:MAG: glycerol dehydrogenase [Clostridiales Family XIII bacterium]|jgi:glycerol dehydrogenase|nr:glycerol dehydrogenase [Clostridiales Family XIII bacterium]